jgi:hypothetical protein
MRSVPVVILIVLVGCGAKSAVHGEAFDAGLPDSWAPCKALTGFVGRFAGAWSGVVNCLEEKHPSQGTLTFEGQADQLGNVRIDGTFGGTFSNGKALRSRVSGLLHCTSSPSVDLVQISVGQAQVGQKLTGWLRGWSVSQAGAPQGSWRVDQWDPLCIGAGSWQAQRLPAR